MVKINIIDGNSPLELENALNDWIKSHTNERTHNIDIQVDNGKFYAIICFEEWESV